MTHFVTVFIKLKKVGSFLLFSEPPREVELLSRIPLSGHEESSNVDVCAWSPEEPLLVTAGTDRKVFLWNLGDPKAVRDRYLMWIVFNF